MLRFVNQLIRSSYFQSPFSEFPYLDRRLQQHFALPSGAALPFASSHCSLPLVTGDVLSPFSSLSQVIGVLKDPFRVESLSGLSEIHEQLPEMRGCVVLGVFVGLSSTVRALFVLEKTIAYWHAMKVRPYTLAVHIGPMFYIRNALHGKWVWPTTQADRITRQLQAYQSMLLVSLTRLQELWSKLHEHATHGLHASDSSAAMPDVDFGVDSSDPSDSLAVPAAAAASLIAQKANGSQDRNHSHSEPPVEVGQLVLLLDEVDKVLDVTRELLHVHRPPSHFRRHWLFYVVFFGTATYGICQAYKHAEQLQSWTQEAKEALSRFFREHVYDPLHNLYEFVRYDKHKALIDQSSVDLSEEALRNMVKDFVRDSSDPLKQVKFTVESVENSVSEGQLLAPIVEAYEGEIRHPIRNLAFGDLPRLILIQIQKQKLDVERTLLALDHLLRNNEINLELVAMTPAFLVVSFLMYQVLTYRRKTDRRVFEMIRVSLLSIERVLNRSLHSGLSEHDQGIVILGFHRVRLLITWETDVSEYFEKEGGRELLLDDLHEIVSPALTVTQRLNVVQRMFRSYPFLQFPSS
ncbi:mitochondrial Complex V (CV) Nca2 regulatory protein (Atp6 and Atp8 expression) [Andalucia godoyi]|uniref:Mitochondrial Complex V (CV) Nca2 regulatory protein (Atp6 and Atp8 expression) n=1 Tax=Andalucia godoyi TaxID=505711 RepID=A0A8K0AHV9_ANDGO|nr:mitochondrial Complex V (CV) Nca2 regulatory protein (Atp6 and Atp8 expression) [Andalucia godoyi]|eukprot:ANDGO_03017.mRNA.1 mitochondrial Complex V (CV) Nca2 regulatory protein (Atp6 and Atp8 expression)